MLACCSAHRICNQSVQVILLYCTRLGIWITLLEKYSLPASEVGTQLSGIFLFFLRAQFVEKCLLMFECIQTLLVRIKLFLDLTI